MNYVGVELMFLYVCFVFEGLAVRYVYVIGICLLNLCLWFMKMFE